MYELKSVTSHTEEYDGNSTTESRTMDIEEGNIGKKEFNYGKKNKLKSCGFFTDNESSFLGKGKMASDKDNQTNAKNNVKITDILNCPWEFHTNFVSMVLFIIGSTFFLYPKLYVAGCIIFAIACVMCVYSNVIGAMNVGREKKNEYIGYLCYVIGCVVFIIGSIYCCFKEDYFAIMTFVVGSIFFLVGAAFFIIAMDFNNIKSVDYKVFIVYVSNLVGGLLFTIASILFFYDSWYNSACYMYVAGSSLFTLATWYDYIIYVTGVA
ncbi:conserved Plasmodium protein, unknown function [Plasmodium knowlesi strain H]|uniref:YrhK domain-containing protein n=3 Tax=Plasmodium knowlesi TaxID=5850 RepID=A0A5K1UUK8_PLAKH|nr:conserved Plasmodium protein, unknown function [Plasmodium knowlesi strain H]OTN66551.1 Uncharacterized protein PKNOH_S08484600 [Plasmodium knowlesi]CAA9986881.1 conserved Plasmodium protein, unknown function [Plasmodium knowlesi strain H]SBO23733.1 conserved Plasmodium protein, unknown function [Plasmodium knowlesi strain H]SBO25415.1 conserved Plasmodium protein, unknown function [Plasmodium knowlesi strain H]VVS76355.1 conserved Plasmodium protein, unknown function [Plasmodium knowlesi s|eukprot:XP_002260636.1 hypothetical protein, conserved in Plasmodium species [Plasmodium knowlesi strain H]